MGPRLRVSAVTATGTAPINDYCLSWHLLLRGVALEQIRRDRVLHEALAVGADGAAPGRGVRMSAATAAAYADTLLERPVEATPGRLSTAPAAALRHRRAGR